MPTIKRSPNCWIERPWPLGQRFRVCSRPQLEVLVISRRQLSVRLNNRDSALLALSFSNGAVEFASAWMNVPFSSWIRICLSRPDVRIFPSESVIRSVIPLLWALVSVPEGVLNSPSHSIAFFDVRKVTQRSPSRSHDIASTL